MGLALGDRIHRISAVWMLPASIMAASVLVHLGGDSTRELLRYDRQGIAGGEVYRLLTGHLTHLDGSHLLLNLAGLGLVWILVGPAFGALEWLVIFVAAAAVIDIGMWFLMPNLDWYVGLSGVLHGLLAAGIVATWRARPFEARILAVAVAAKLAWEAIVGPMPGSSGLVASDVLTEAHLFGAVGGVIAAITIVNMRPRALESVAKRRYNAPPSDSE